MLLKTYQAADLASALERARAEMGASALVLATRDLPGPSGLSGVEVTVGAPRSAISAATETAVTDTAPPRGAGEARVAAQVQDRAPSSDLAARLACAAREEGAPSGEPSLSSGQVLSRLLPFGGLPDRPGSIFVVGPPGCGKTTTVAKLAARRMVGSHGEVVLAAADQERIGGVEQARIYGRHLGIPVVPVETAEDLRIARRKAGPDGTVLIDTAGIGSRDFQRYESLHRLRAHCPEAELVLLLPAGLHRDEAVRILDRFEPLHPTRVAFSRVDDGRRLQELVSAAAPTRVPLAFLTTGHRVPDDLADATPALLASLLLRSAPGSGRIQETAG